MLQSEPEQALRHTVVSGREPTHGNITLLPLSLMWQGAHYLTQVLRNAMGGSSAAPAATSAAAATQAPSSGTLPLLGPVETHMLIGHGGSDDTVCALVVATRACELRRMYAFTAAPQASRGTSMRVSYGIYMHLLLLPRPAGAQACRSLL